MCNPLWVAVGIDRSEGNEEDQESEEGIMTKTTFPTVAWNGGQLIVLALSDQELENHPDQETARAELTRRNEQRAELRKRLMWNRG